MSYLITNHEQRKIVLDEETETDKNLRKCTLINLLFLVSLIATFESAMLIGFGIYHFRRIDQADCYASVDSDLPSSIRIIDTQTNVSF